MRVTQQLIQSATTPIQLPASSHDVLLLAFGSPTLFEQLLPRLLALFPRACIAGCSTAGEILATEIFEDSLVLSVLEFEHTPIGFAGTELDDSNDVAAAAQRLVQQLPSEKLRHVLLLSDGLHVNGSLLASAMNQHLPLNVTLTGGLAGDGSRFGQTHIFDRDGAHQKRVIAVGLYGDAIRVGFGSVGGWDSFGPDRRITRAQHNVLYELDGQSALALYKMYLGDYANELPASALLFPLNVHQGDDKKGVVRTVLGVNEEDQSMTFAGDMPVGAFARLMRANFDRLIDGAKGAAHHASLQDSRADFALLISCVGRRLILKQRSEEEVESVQNVIGSQARLSGFYSYGELCPSGESRDCHLHNQTMTITTLTEA